MVRRCDCCERASPGESRHGIAVGFIHCSSRIIPVELARIPCMCASNHHIKLDCIKESIPNGGEYACHSKLNNICSGWGSKRYYDCMKRRWDSAYTIRIRIITVSIQHMRWPLINQVQTHNMMILRLLRSTSTMMHMLFTK